MIEYLTEIIDALNDDTLNELGSSGWQLITIYDDVAYFMRSKQVLNIPTRVWESIDINGPAELFGN